MIISQGWPETKDKIPESLAPYFSFCDELTIHDGLIFKGEQLVIPLKGQTLHQVKTSCKPQWHTGIIKTSQRVHLLARDEPESDVYISKCTVCTDHPQDQAKEPLITHDLPIMPWPKTTCDLFELNQKDYLITVLITTPVSLKLTI